MSIHDTCWIPKHLKYLMFHHLLTSSKVPGFILTDSTLRDVFLLLNILDELLIKQNFLCFETHYKDLSLTIPQNPGNRQVCMVVNLV